MILLDISFFSQIPLFSRKVDMTEVRTNVTLVKSFMTIMSNIFYQEHNIYDYL